MDEIPTDTHIRNLLDLVRPAEFAAEFTFLLEEMADSGHLTPWRVLGDRLAFSRQGWHNYPFFCGKMVCCLVILRRLKALMRRWQVWIRSRLTAVGKI
jgi:hypothetical protein